MRRFMRLFFHLLYHPLSWTYDIVANTVSLGRWQQWVGSVLPRVAGPHVLELGYGPGHLQARLHAGGYAAFGLDESMNMAKQASARLRKAGRAPRLARGLAQRLPFAAGVFNSVIATFPTLYITDPSTLAEIRRVLKPGGRLVVLMGAWITGQSLGDRFMRAVFRITQQVPPDDLPLEQLTRPYEEAGFQARVRFIELPGSRVMIVEAG